MSTEDPKDSKTASILDEVLEELPGSTEEIKIDEPSRKPPIGVDTVQVIRHYEHWSFVMNAAFRTNVGSAEDPQWAYKIMVPQWEDLPPDTPIPGYAALPLQGHAVQQLFDEMWQQGFRPTGTQVIMEIHPDIGIQSEVQAMRAELSQFRNQGFDLSEAQVPEEHVPQEKAQRTVQEMDADADDLTDS